MDSPKLPSNEIPSPTEPPGGTAGIGGSGQNGPADAPFIEPTGIEELSLSDIEQAPLIPPREPLGARIASLMGQHHTFLATLCVLLLWAIVAMPPLWQAHDYQRGREAPHDIIAPHAASVRRPLRGGRDPPPASGSGMDPMSEEAGTAGMSRADPPVDAAPRTLAGAAADDIARCVLTSSGPGMARR